MNANVEIRSTFISPSEAPAGCFEPVLDYWNALRGDRWAAPWPEVSLVSLPAAMIPSISVTDIEYAPLRSTYRFWGTNLTAVFGHDYTGKAPSDVPPRSLGLSTDGGCAHLAHDKVPHCEVKEFTTVRGYRGRALVLRLPCSNDGESVSQGINVYHFEHVDPNARLDWFFREIFEPLEREQLPLLRTSAAT